MNTDIFRWRSPGRGWSDWEPRFDEEGTDLILFPDDPDFRYEVKSVPQATSGHEGYVSGMPSFKEWSASKDPVANVERAKAYLTKDSGERLAYASGMVRDTQAGKPRWDLVIPADQPYAEQFLTRVAELMGRGAEKYGDRNWEKGHGAEEYERAKGSALRHFMQWFCGETDEDHAAAVFFNIQQAEYNAWKRREPQAGQTPAAPAAAAW